MTSAESTEYGDGINDIADTNYDWGVYNTISNGGNKTDVWRTLTKDEWNYLINDRKNAENLQGPATVQGHTGYVLLPDEWSTPSGLSFAADSKSYSKNSYSYPEWSRMEAAGAVFLPAAGYRSGTSVNYVGTNGYYWSSTYNVSYDAYCFSFTSSDVNTSYYYYRYNGHSVRLVQE